MKTKTIPFDLETAKKIQAGEIEGKIRMECGDNVRIVCWDSTVRYCGFSQPIIAQEEGDGDLYAYFESGRYVSEEEHPKDLVLEVPYNEPYFKPFDKVLVRNDGGMWCCSFFSHIDYSLVTPTVITTDNNAYKHCIPYEGNEHLVGTDKEPNEQ